MDTTCFFVENLLSDYVEGALPSHRHAEVRAHLTHCPQCTSLEERLHDTLEALRSVRFAEVDSELFVRVTEAATSQSRAKFSWPRVAKGAAAAVIFSGIFWGITLAFPGALPEWLSFSPREESSFVRYFPLQQGGQEILEEQSSWLHTREVTKGSLWEEGGLSPDEFEKAFQVRKRDSNLEEAP